MMHSAPVQHVINRWGYMPLGMTAPHPFHYHPHAAISCSEFTLSQNHKHDNSFSEGDYEEASCEDNAFVSDHERAIQNAHILAPSNEFENFQISPLLQNGETSWELMMEEEEEWGKIEDKLNGQKRTTMTTPSLFPDTQKENVLQQKDLNNSDSFTYQCWTD